MAGHFVTPTTLIPQILIGSLQLGLDYYCERKIQSSPRGNVHFFECLQKKSTGFFRSVMHRLRKFRSWNGNLQ